LNGAEIIYKFLYVVILNSTQHYGQKVGISHGKLKYEHEELLKGIKEAHHSKERIILD
jgi:hypothetical protein